MKRREAAITAVALVVVLPATTIGITTATGGETAATQYLTGLSNGDVHTDGFEDGDLSEYSDVDAASTTTSTVYHGEYAATLVDRNEEMFRQNGHYTGNRIYRDLSPSQPTQLSAAVRIDDGTWNDLRIYWRNETNGAVVGVNLDVHHGQFFYNSAEIAPIEPYTWYNVTFTGLDWEDNTVDQILLDGEVVARDRPFLNSANGIHNLTMSVNDGGTGSRVWFDNVSLSGENAGGNSQSTPTATPAPESTGGSEEPLGNSSGPDGSETAGNENEPGGIATTFRRSVEDSGPLGLLFGVGLAGGGYLVYRGRQEDDEKKSESTQTCPKCEQRVSQSVNYCDNCGTDLTTTTESQSTAIEQGTQQGTEPAGGARSTSQQESDPSRIEVSAYHEIAVGEIVETGEIYQIATGSLQSADTPVWLATPATDGETMDATQTEALFDRIEPWAKIDSHQHLLSVYGHGTEPLPWIATEPATYPLLADSAGECSIPQMLELLAQVCEAVHHVRRYGLAYESLGLESVLFISPQEVQLRGILDQLDPVERSSYELPNQNEDHTAEAAAVYRLGALAYDILTAQPPAGDATAVTPPSELNPSVSESVDTVVLQALAADPEERQETVLHLRDSLRESAR